MSWAQAFEFLAAMIASAGGCWLMARGVTPRPDTLAPQMLRTSARVLWVLLLITLGIGVMKRTPWAITVGVLAGWAAAGAWSEALGVPRKGMHE
jgi:hypothetical protein